MCQGINLGKLLRKLDNVIFGAFKKRNKKMKYCVRRFIVVIVVLTAVCTTYGNIVDKENIGAHSNNEELINSEDVYVNSGEVDEATEVTEETDTVWSGEYSGSDIRNLSDKVYTEEELYKLPYDVSFIASVLPFVREVSKKYNLYGSVMLAQACLESDYGRSTLTHQALNLFGVKAREGQNYVSMRTLEDKGVGDYYEIVDKFAKYDSYKESFEGYAQLLRGGLNWDSTYYSGAWKENANDYRDVSEVLTGKYATDKLYAGKINKIIEKYNLAELDK